MIILNIWKNVPNHQPGNNIHRDLAQWGTSILVFSHLIFNPKKPPINPLGISWLDKHFPDHQRPAITNLAMNPMKSYLVGGAITVNGKDDIPSMMENKIHVWNHQPAICFLVRFHHFPMLFQCFKAI